MNRSDYQKIMGEIMGEIREPQGTFQSTFGRKTEKELEEIQYIAGIALYAADRLYAHVSQLDFEIKEKNKERGCEERCEKSES